MEEDQMVAMLEEGYDPLELSIRKWENIAYGDDEYLGPNNCALCHITKQRCERCPIGEATGEEFCRGTPLVDVERAMYDDKDLREPAKKMLAYLISLRPKGKAKASKTKKTDVENIMKRIDTIAESLNDSIEEIRESCRVIEKEETHISNFIEELDDSMTDLVDARNELSKS
jgi:exonuclease VII small subunit